MRYDRHPRVERGNGFRSCLDLGAADIASAKKDLTLQIGQAHLVVICKAKGAHPCGRQIERGRTAQAAGADHQHLGSSQFRLPHAAHLAQNQMARITVKFVVAQPGHRFTQSSPYLEMGSQSAPHGVTMQ